ncbi:MAG: hypothetical protein KJ000_18570 [Pirellulaceae bacterium]|nr:hypothetical protein [Pirellulaceae bacterium]
MLATDVLLGGQVFSVIDNGDPGYIESAPFEATVDDGSEGYRESQPAATVIVGVEDPEFVHSGLGVDATVDNGDDGYLELGTGWGQSTAGGEIDGQSRFSWDNNARAEFHFAGLPVGMVDILFTIPKRSNSTVAKYTVASAGQTHTLAGVNQRNASGGWDLLATVYSDGGPLTVTVAQDDHSGVLRTDAVKVSTDGWRVSTASGLYGSGAVWAEYRFTAANRGLHEIWVDTPGHANSTESAVYTVVNNGNPVDMFVASQKASTDGFQSLGSVDVDPGEVVVRVTNGGSDYLRADRMQLVDATGWFASVAGGWEGDSRFSRGPDARANYRFDDLEPGLYDLLVQRPGHSNSTSVAIYDVEVNDSVIASFTESQKTGTSGWEKIGLVTVGGVGMNTVEITVRNGDPASGLLRADALRLEIPGWNDSSLGGVDGDSRWTTGGSATYTFDGLTPGQAYQIYVNTPGSPSSATAAMYSVTSGGVVICDPGLVLNQTTATMSKNGNIAGWLSLGDSFTVAAGADNLTIMVSQDRSADTLLRTDAVALLRQPVELDGVSLEGTIRTGDGDGSQYVVSVSAADAVVQLDRIWIDWGDGTSSRSDSSDEIVTVAPGEWTAIHTLSSSAAGAPIRVYGYDAAGTLYQATVELQPAAFDVAAEVFSAGEMRLTWNDGTDGQASYEISASGDGGATFQPLLTTQPGATAALLTGLTPDTAYTIRLAPIGGGNGQTMLAALPVQTPAATANDNPQQWYRVTLDSALLKGSAGYTEVGHSTTVLNQIQVASEEAAIWGSITGWAKIRSHSGEQKQFNIGDNGAYKVDTFGDLTNSIADFGLGATYDADQWLLTLEDTFEWTNIDLDYDDWYWLVRVEKVTLLTISGDESYNEDAGVVTINIELSDPAPSAFSLTYTINGTGVHAATDADFAANTHALSGTVSFAQGATSPTALLKFEINDDDIDEYDQAFNIELSGDLPAGVKYKQDGNGNDIDFHEAEIVDNDDEPEVSIAPVPVQEGQTADATIKLSRKTEKSPEYVYYTLSNSATAIDDYSIVTGSWTVGDTETEKTVRVDASDDAIDEGTETYTLEVGLATATQSSAIGRIIIPGIDLDTDINNDGAITDADDPDDDPGYEEAHFRPGKGVLVGGIAEIAVDLGDTTDLAAMRYHLMSGGIVLSEEDAFTVEFQMQGLVGKLWTSPAKTQEISLGTRMSLSDVPSSVYYEATAAGSGLVGAAIRHATGGVWSSDVVRISTIRLDELTVTHHGNDVNSVTADDSVMPDLYLGIDDDASAAAEPNESGIAVVDIEVDVDPLSFGPQGTGRLVKIYIMRAHDGLMVYQGNLSSGNTLSNQQLPVHNNGTPDDITDDWNQFFVVAWLDENDDGNLNGAENARMVNVQVVPPWSRVGDWNETSAIAKAGYDGAPLPKLAEAITGQDIDAALVNGAAPITRGEHVNVVPLIDALEQRVRNSIVSAAVDPSSIGATFGSGAPAGWGVGELDEQKIESLFDGTAGVLPAYACTSMRSIVTARGLIGVLKPGEFDAVFANPDNLHGYAHRKDSEPLNALEQGDWVRFWNDTRVTNEWRWEDAIVTESYWGWPNGNQGWTGWMLSLIAGGVASGVADPIPRGYEQDAPGSAYELDFPRIAQELFDHRSTPQ